MKGVFATKCKTKKNYWKVKIKKWECLVKEKRLEMQKVFHDNRAAMQINTICAVPKGVEVWGPFR